MLLAISLLHLEYDFVDVGSFATSSSSAFPALCLWFTILGEIFAYMTGFVFFFNPTIEVVTFRPHGWYILGVFLLSAFTCLGHECQDLSESLRWNACVHRLDLSFYSHPRVLG